MEPEPVLRGSLRRRPPLRLDLPASHDPVHHPSAVGCGQRLRARPPAARGRFRLRSCAHAPHKRCRLDAGRCGLRVQRFCLLAQPMLFTLRPGDGVASARNLGRGAGDPKHQVVGSGPLVGSGWPGAWPDPGGVAGPGLLLRPARPGRLRLLPHHAVPAGKHKRHQGPIPGALLARCGRTDLRVRPRRRRAATASSVPGVVQFGERLRRHRRGECRLRGMDDGGLGSVVGTRSRIPGLGRAGAGHRSTPDRPRTTRRALLRRPRAVYHHPGGQGRNAVAFCALPFVARLRVDTPTRPGADKGDPLPRVRHAGRRHPKLPRRAGQGGWRPARASRARLALPDHPRRDAPTARRDGRYVRRGP